MSSILISCHSNLAYYFASKPLYLDEPTQKKPDTRKLVEQPWQELEAAKNIEKHFEKNPEIKELQERLWNNVTNNLCNLDFIQAKAVAKMTYELVNDFNDVLEVIPDNAENLRKENERQAKMDKYTQDLIAYSKGEISELEIPESITPWTKEQIETEIERIKTCPTKIDVLRDFFNFLIQEAGNLQKYAYRFTHFAIQQAWNYANIGPVGSASRNASDIILGNLLLQSPYTCPDWNPISQFKGIFRGIAYFLSIAITPDFKKAITGDARSSCTLWDIKSNKPIKVLNHDGCIYSVSITPDGKKAISGSDNKTCIVWDLELGRELFRLTEHTDIIYTVAISGDGKVALSGSFDKTCIVWNLVTGKILHILKGHIEGIMSVSVTPNWNLAISGSRDNNCILWDIKTGNAIRTLKGHSHPVNVVSITADGKKAISGSAGGEIIFWNLETGNIIHQYKKDDTYISSVSITPDGRIAVAGTWSLTCIVWNLETGEELGVLKGHTYFIDSLCITPDAKIAISASRDRTCKIWDLSLLKIIKSSKIFDFPLFDYSTSSNNKYLIPITYEDNFKLLDFNTGFRLQTFKGHSGGINTVVFLQNAELSISASRDQTCIIWETKTGRIKNILKGHIGNVRSISITPDGKRAITGSSDNNCILWNLVNGGEIKKLLGHAKYVNFTEITPNGKLAITQDADGFVIIWDLVQGRLLHNFETGNVHKISPDGKILFSNEYKYIFLRNIKSQSIVNQLETRFIDLVSMIISPDGKLLITGSEEGVCIIWEIRTGKVLHFIAVHTSRIRAITMSFDGTRLITGSDDNSTIIWDIKNKKKIGVFLSDDIILKISFYPWGILGICPTNVFNLKVDRNIICPSYCILTIRQIWDYDLNEYTQPLADCPLCGHRFEPPQSIIQTIIKILNENNISPDQSPCMELPDEAWEHPGLLGECPNCHEKLKFNPFFGSEMKDITDYYSSLERENIYQKMLDEADNAFNNGDWENANYLYLKLVQQGKFDINEMRFKMALCQINRINDSTSLLIDDVNILMKILKDKGSSDKALLVSNKLKERMEAIKQEELAKKKAAAPWWKKIVGN